MPSRKATVLALRGHAAVALLVVGVALLANITLAEASHIRIALATVDSSEEEVELTPFWNSLQWTGRDGVAVEDVLREGRLLDSVLAVFYWDDTSQTWLSFFPGLSEIPGLNSLIAFEREKTYWIAVTAPVTWTVESPTLASQLPLPSVTSVQFFGDFTEDQRVRYEEAIRTELASAARFYRDRYGLVTPDLEFRLSTRDAPGDLGFAYGGGIIYLRQERMEPVVEELRGGTITWSIDEFEFLGPLAHEYVHALQDAAGSLGGPLWIREGMAWYLDALHDRTREEPSRFKSREQLLWEARGSTLTLPMMETGNWHWGLGYVAIEQLVERSSEGALFDFYRNLAGGYDSWQDAFASAFEMTVDAFYEHFAAWRAREAPPQAFFSGVVVDPDDNPVEGIWVIAARTWSIDPETGERTFSSWIEHTRDDGTFDVRARPSAESVIFIGARECPHIGLLAKDGSLTRIGAEARRFEIDLEGVSDLTITLPGTIEELCTPETADSFNAFKALGWIR